MRSGRDAGRAAGRARRAARRAPRQPAARRVVDAHAVKLGNRRCERCSSGWAEPWAALGRRLGGGPARRAPGAPPRLALAVAEPGARLALRLLDRRRHRAGDGALRATPRSWRARPRRACSSASPASAPSVARRGRRSRTSWSSTRRRIRAPTSCACRSTPIPPSLCRSACRSCHRCSLARAERAALDRRRPARARRRVRRPEPPRWLPGQQPLDVEFVAADVPAFGCAAFGSFRACGADDEVDDGARHRDCRRPRGGRRRRHARRPPRRCEFRGLLAVEDRGDRGDTYDFDPVDGRPRRPARSTCAGAAGAIPPASQGLDGDAHLRRAARARRRPRAPRRRAGTRHAHRLGVRLAPGVPRVDLTVRVDNTARDHRLRLLFPTGRPAATPTPRPRSTSRRAPPRRRRRRGLGPSGAPHLSASGLGARERPHRRRTRRCRRPR